MEIRINRCIFAAALGIIAVLAISGWWLSRPPEKTRGLSPLFAELDAWKVSRGSYPTSCVGLVSFQALTNQFKIYTGGFASVGVIWEPREVSRHDITVLVDRNGYVVFVPVGRMKMYSFSSFPVWRRTSLDHSWRKGRIHWSLSTDYSGTYWSEH